MVHILEPDFDSGCTNLTDSSYYIYSLGGYAPCFYLDFTATYNITVDLICEFITPQ